MDQDSFAERVKTLIMEYGGVSTIARKCGFSEGVVRSWRDGRSDPSRGRCLSLARGLGVSLIWIVAGEGPMRDASAETEPTHAATSQGMDSRRLSAAAEVLQSTLNLVGSDLSLPQNTDLLAEYYELLGETDAVTRARMAARLHARLRERVRKTSA